MSPEQSRELKVGQRVFWLGDNKDCGVVAQRDWTGVRIRWDNGQTSFHYHNDMRDIATAPIRV